MIVDLPDLARSLRRKQDDAAAVIAHYEANGVPMGWEPPRRKGEPQRPLFVRTSIRADLAAAAMTIGGLLDREPMISGNGRPSVSVLLTQSFFHFCS